MLFGHYQSSLFIRFYNTNLFLDQKVFIFVLLHYLAFQVQHWGAE